MLPLDSPRWNFFAGAYNAGGAEVVQQLKEIAENNDSNFDEFIQNICHQQTVSTLSYAAVPHLVTAAKKTSNPEFRDKLLFLTASVCSANFVGQKAPADIECWYKNSANEARELAIAILKSNDTLGHTSWSLWCILALSFQYEVALALESLCVDEEFELMCPKCNFRFYLHPKMELSIIETENHIAVKEGPLAVSKWSDMYSWLSGLLEGISTLEKERAFLPSLFGTATCPSCQKEISLLDCQTLVVLRHKR